MNTTNSDRRRLVEIVRWLAVIPAAIVGGWCGEVIGSVLLGGPLRLAESAGLIALTSANTVGSLHAFTCYLPAGIARGAAALATAPRFHKPLAAIVIGTVGTASAVRHLIAPYSAGHPIGVVNGMDFACDTLGAVIGVGLVMRWQNRSVAHRDHIALEDGRVQETGNGPPE